MRLGKIICIVPALLWQSLLHAQLSGSASISGRVINSANSEPLIEAFVILHLDAPGDLAATAATDSAGRFAFDNLPAGTYLLEARHTGFDTAWFGACTGEKEGAPLQVKPGEKRAGLFIALAPEAVVTGTVTGSDGEPVRRAVVVVHSSSTRPGQRVSKRLSFLSNGTDEHGRYRVFGIPAGKYVVSAASGDPVFLAASLENGQQDAPYARYQAVYYPGTPSRDEAAVIKLSPGEVRQNVDFQLSVIRAATIEVNFRLPPDVEEPENVSASLNSAFENSLLGFGFSTSGSTKGPIDFGEVYPGVYDLRLFAKKNGHSFASYNRIDVSADEGSRKLTVQLSPPVTIHGSIHTDSLPLDPKCCRISLKPVVEVAVEDIHPVYASILPGGNFVIPNVLPGAWIVDIQSIPDGSYIKSVRFAGKDVSHEPLIADASTTGTLDIVIGSKAAEIFGSVTNAKSGKVLLAPVHDVEKPYLYRVTTVAPDGAFQIRDVPPGSYNLFAFRTLEDEDWLDPEFRARIAGSAVTVELKDGSKLRTDLTAIDPKSANCAEQVR